MSHSDMVWEFMCWRAGELCTFCSRQVIQQAVCAFGARFLCIVSGRKNCKPSESQRWLSVGFDEPPSARTTCSRPQTQRVSRLHAAPCHLLSPNYSRLEPVLLSLILSVWGLWRNSDISVWCLPYVSRALPGPIKLIFNVRPTQMGSAKAGTAAEETWLAFVSALTLHSVVPCQTCGRAWCSVVPQLIEHLQQTETSPPSRDKPKLNV